MNYRNQNSSPQTRFAWAVLLGCALATPAAAQVQIDMIQKADPSDVAPTMIYNGHEVPRPDEGEFTNEQPACSFSEDGKRFTCTAMSTANNLGPDNNGSAKPGPEAQGACFQGEVQMDASSPTGVKMVVTSAQYLPGRDGNNYRNYNHPNQLKKMIKIGNKEYTVATSVYAPNAQARRYMAILDGCTPIDISGTDENGNALPTIDNGRAVEIMYSENDNCSGRQAGGGADAYVDANGVIQYASEELCNGNGEDAGYLNRLSISIDPNAGSATVDKKFDTVFIEEEERSRGTCMFVDTDDNGSQETIVCCGNAGNNQPQEEGVWVGGYDAETGAELYNVPIDVTKNVLGRLTYARRLKCVKELDANDNPTGNILASYNFHRGNNRNGEKGGYTMQIIAMPMDPTRTSPGVINKYDSTQHYIENLVNAAHQNAFLTIDADGNAGFAAISGSMTAVIANSKTIAIKMDANGAFASNPIQTAPYDAHTYSNYLGNNPNNQGRNFAWCDRIPNPYLSNPGPQQGITHLNTCFTHGKVSSPDYSIKPDLVASTWLPYDLSGDAPEGQELPPASDADAPPTANPQAQFASSSGCSSPAPLGLGLLLVAAVFMMGRSYREQR